MSEYLIQSETLTSIADAIRDKSKKTGAIQVSDMPSEIASILSSNDILNFSVVGETTQPTNPTENMIWVNTDVEISSWSFDYREPTAEPGKVWFLMGSSSVVRFNALKINDIQVYPVSVKQYINGAWVNKTVMSYQNNNWTDFKIYLYNSGNECTTLTGGWKGANYRYHSNTSKSTPTVTKKDTYISLYNTCSSGSSKDGCMTTISKINMDSYNVLHMDLDADRSGTGDCWIGLVAYNAVSNNTMTGGASVRVKVPITELELDVSNLTGDYYIAVSMILYNSVSSCGANIERIYLI